MKNGEKWGRYPFFEKWGRYPFFNIKAC
jgi:hypothetical protein